jgi:hypothetical protein
MTRLLLILCLFQLVAGRAHAQAGDELTGPTTSSPRSLSPRSSPPSAKPTLPDEARKLELLLTEDLADEFDRYHSLRPSGSGFADFVLDEARAKRRMGMGVALGGGFGMLALGVGVGLGVLAGTGHSIGSSIADSPESAVVMALFTAGAVAFFAAGGYVWTHYATRIRKLRH